MKITNTHFILGTILFVVIMISLTTSCCDFMPYSRPRGSLGMSVYEGMKEKTKEGLDGDEDEEKTKEGLDGEEDEEKTKEGLDGDEDEAKEGFGNRSFGNFGVNSNNALGGGSMGSKSVFGGGDIANSGGLGGGGGIGLGFRSGNNYGNVQGIKTSGQPDAQNNIPIIQQQNRGIRKPGSFENMTNKNTTEPSPMSALTQSVFGSSMSWSK